MLRASYKPSVERLQIFASESLDGYLSPPTSVPPLIGLQLGVTLIIWLYYFTQQFLLIGWNLIIMTMPSPGFKLRSPSPKVVMLPTELTLQDNIEILWNLAAVENNYPDFRHFVPDPVCQTQNIFDIMPAVAHASNHLKNWEEMWLRHYALLVTTWKIQKYCD